MASPLHKFRILIADSDQQLSIVSKLMLQQMGFVDIHLTNSGKNALKAIKSDPFDFILTDWNLKDLDGISLLERIRRDPDSPNPTMPVLMLTGRAEESDVHTARDRGIHEYLLKPFSAKTIYERLERVVEFPRYFVVGREFVGPDRRRRQGAAPGGEERRKNRPLAQRKPWQAAKAIGNADTPKLWLPDLSLKHKLGQNVRLDSIVTPTVLTKAQAAIAGSSADSLKWIQEDLAELKSLYAVLAESTRPQNVIDSINEVALMISSRSGTFGYTRASEVAYMLYLFCRRKLNPKDMNHYKVLDKHIEVLSFIFAAGIHGEEGTIVEITQELKNLTAKYAP